MIIYRSYEMLLITVFGVMQCLRGLRLKKTHCFPHTVHYCCCSLQFLQSNIILRSEACSDWPAIQCAVIGRIPQACDEMLRPLPYLETQSLHDNNTTARHLGGVMQIIQQ